MRLGRVEADPAIGAPSGPRPPGKRTLYISGGHDGISDAFEGDKEGVALRIDLPALMLRECRPQYLAVLVEYVRVPPAQPLTNSVDRTMSVKRNVTVPPGCSPIAPLIVARSLEAGGRSLPTRIGYGLTAASAARSLTELRSRDHQHRHRVTVQVLIKGLAEDSESSSAAQQDRVAGVPGRSREAAKRGRVGACAVLEARARGAVYRQAGGSSSQNLPETEGMSSMATITTRADREQSTALTWGVYLMTLGAIAFIGYGVIFFVLNFTDSFLLRHWRRPRRAARTRSRRSTTTSTTTSAPLQIALSGFIAATGLAVAALSWFGVRRRYMWAWVAAVAAPVLALAVALPAHYPWGSTRSDTWV